MSTEDNQPSLLDDRIEDLNMTRDIRRRLLMKNLPNGEMPNDIESQEMVLKIAGEIDRSVSTVAKIENDRARMVIDRNNSQSQQKFIDNMTRVLGAEIGLRDQGTGETLELPPELAQLKDMVPGEMDVGAGPLELKDFVS